MEPPIKNLFVGVEVLHTREYLLKISAQMVGCRQRSKIASKNSKNERTGAELVFLEREEGGGRRHTWLAALWAPGALWARPGGRPHQLAAWATGGPPGQPQVPLGHSRHGNFYFYFSGIFLKTSLLKISRSSKSCKTF